MSSSSASSRSGASVSQAADDSDFDDEASKLEGSEASGDEDATNSGEDSSGQASEESNVTSSPGEDSCGQASEAVQNSDLESSRDANNSDDSGGQASEAVENSDRKSSSDANDSDANHSDDSTEDKAMAVGQPIQVLETRAEHLARHSTPEEQENCERCRFYLQEGKISARWTVVIGARVKTFVIEHPDVERKRKPWRIGCGVCFALADKPWSYCRYAECDVPRYTHKGWLKHCKSPRHKAAVEKLQARVVNGPQEAAAREAAASASSAGQVTRYKCGISPAHVTTIVKMMHATQSLRQFPKEMAAVRSHGACGDSPGNDSRLVARQLVQCLRSWEQFQTRELLRASSIIGLAQDAREPFLLVLARSVIWEWPNSLLQFPVTGVQSLHWPKDGGPWISERILGAEALGTDRTGPTLAKQTVAVVKRATLTPECYEETKKKIRSMAADNAADENVVKDELAKEFENLNFLDPDTTHSFQLGIKNGAKGDPEVDLVQGICCTNKKPYPSIANMLRCSNRFRKRFIEKQRDSIMNVLSHLGWAPQRHSSRSRTYTRESLLIGQLLEALAHEAEDGRYKEAAAYNITQIAPYPRMMIAGMMGDLTCEHHAALRPTDAKDPDPGDVDLTLLRLKQRLKLLFAEGEVMRLPNTYTGQILKFLENPSAVFSGRHAVLFGMPDRNDQAAIYEPLQRMRPIVVNVIVCLEAALPSNSWQRQFSAFALPSPLGRSGPLDGALTYGPRIKKLFRERFTNIFAQARLNPEETLKELLQIETCAVTFLKQGCTQRQAWAKASLSYPELLRARAAVDLLLGLSHVTGEVERFLKRLASRTVASDGKNEELYMEDFLLCDVHTPKLEDIQDDAPRSGQALRANAGGDGQAPLTDKGKAYVNKIIACYGKCYRGRRFAKRPARRRDVNGTHVTHKKRKSEVAFRNEREASIRDALHDPDRAAKQARCRLASPISKRVFFLGGAAERGGAGYGCAGPEARNILTPVCGAEGEGGRGAWSQARTHSGRHQAVRDGGHLESPRRRGGEREAEAPGHHRRIEAEP